LKISDVMSQNEWSWLHNFANKNQVNPVLLASIGWHETHWGRLGMGKYGFHISHVGCEMMTNINMIWKEAKLTKNHTQKFQLVIYIAHLLSKVCKIKLTGL